MALHEDPIIPKHSTFTHTLINHKERQHITRVIAISGGKGGVGKTQVSINLGTALAQQGQEVVLFDADLGLANVDIALGLRVKNTVLDVLQGRCPLQDIFIKGPSGLNVIPGASGKTQLSRLSSQEVFGLIHAFGEIENPIDTLLIDTAAGIDASMLEFCQASQEVMVVICNEPASLTDAYALIKILNQQYQVKKFRIVTNRVRSMKESQDLFAKLTNVTESFLNVNLHLMGSIPEDKLISQCIQKQKAVVEQFPSSNVSLRFKELAKQIVKLPLSKKHAGNLQFFLEQHL